MSIFDGKAQKCINYVSYFLVGKCIQTVVSLEKYISLDKNVKENKNKKKESTKTTQFELTSFVLK